MFSNRLMLLKDKDLTKQKPSLHHLMKQTKRNLLLLICAAGISGFYTENLLHLRG